MENMKRLEKIAPASRVLNAAWLLLLATLFGLFFFGSNSPLGEAIGSDNAIYLTMGTALKQGYAPYTQVFDHKGPLLFVFQALAQIMGGGYSTLAVFVMETLFLWGCLMGIGALARRKHAAALPAQMILLLLLAPVIDGGNYCEEYSNLFTMLGALVMLHVFDRETLSEKSGDYVLPAALYGALMMASFLVRANNMLPMAGMIVGAALFMLATRRIGQLGACAAGVLLGCAAVVLPTALWLLSQGALSEAIYGAFLHNMMYAETNGASRLGMLLHSSYGYRAMGMAALACGGGLLYAAKHRRAAIALMMIFGAALGGMAAFISHKFYSHYLMLGAPLAAVGAVLLFAAIGASFPRGTKAAAAAVVLLCAAQLFSIGQGKNAQRAQMHTEYETLFAQTQELLAQVPTQERDELFAYRVEPKWYVAAEAMPYMRFYFLQEILGQADPAVMDEIVETFENAPPKWLVIYYQRAFSPAYDTRVQEIFDTRYEFVDARGQYQLLRRKENPS